MNKKEKSSEENFGWAKSIDDNPFAVMSASSEVSAPAANAGISAPFEIKSSVPDRETYSNEDLPAYKRLPVITFELTVDGKNFRITTDDPDIFGTQFNHPADIDKILARTSRLRATVHEAYLQCVRRRKITIKEFDTWKSTMRGKVAANWDTQKQGKQTLEAIGDYLKSMFATTFDELEKKVWDAEEQEERIKDFYDAIKQRAFDLKPVAERFFQSQAEYKELFNN
jgi:hypothetical protein